MHYNYLANDSLDYYSSSYELYKSGIYNICGLHLVQFCLALAAKAERKERNNIPVYKIGCDLTFLYIK